jgi:hypothetical protein
MIGRDELSAAHAVCRPGDAFLREFGVDADAVLLFAMATMPDDRPGGTPHFMDMVASFTMGFEMGMRVAAMNWLETMPVTEGAT